MVDLTSGAMALGLHFKLQPTRSDLVGLRPMARQATARGCLRWRGWPGVLWHAARDALYGFGCGLPLTSRPGRPAHVARRSRCVGQLPRWRLEVEYLAAGRRSAVGWGADRVCRKAF